MSIEAMKMALEALELSHPRFGVGTAIYIKSVTALRQAIEQAEQHDELTAAYMSGLYDGKSEWVGLTREDKDDLVHALPEFYSLEHVIQATEAKLKVRNGG